MKALTLDTARSLLPCSKHTLDDDLERQPEMVDRVSQAAARAEGDMLRMKDKVARVEARLTDDFKDGDAKLTKDQLEAKVKRHPARVEAFDAYMDSQELYREWAGLLEAWRAKGFSMKELANLYASDYFVRDSASAPPRRDQASARASMRQASEAAGAPTARRRAVLP